MLLLAAAVNAQLIFNYRMGEKIEGEPDGVNEDGLSYKYMLNPPKGYDGVIITYTESAGVCSIKAVVRVDDGENDFDLSRHKEAVDRLAYGVRLETGIGSPVKTDNTLDGGSDYSYKWTMKRSGVYRDVESITIDARGPGFAVKQFDFRNHRQCYPGGDYGPSWYMAFWNVLF